MKTKLEKPTIVLKYGDGEHLFEFSEIVEHIKNNANCEFIRIIERYSEMSLADRKKFIDYAERL